MEYLKLFENHSQYEDFIETEDFVRPNVSHCIYEDEVHYNPLPAFILVNFTVPEDEEDTLVWLYNNVGVKFIEIDYLENETVLGAILSSYEFWHFGSSVDGVDIYEIATNVILPDTIKEISSWTLCRLCGCSVSVPQNLEHVGNNAFAQESCYDFTEDELSFIFSVSDGQPFIIPK